MLCTNWILKCRSIELLTIIFAFRISHQMVCMKNLLLGFIIFMICILSNTLYAQILIPTFGKGIPITAQDSSVYINTSFRFQTLMTNQWDVQQDQISELYNHESSFLIRRARLKFKGWAVSPKFKYNLELAFSNRDNGGGNTSRFSNAANIVLSAEVECNFYKGLSIWAGQGKLPGNRERIISSGNLQFVDRSALNSNFNIDRDVGVMLKNVHKFNDQFILRETIAVTKGEGKSLTAPNVGGMGYTLKIEALPFGLFQGNGEYGSGFIVRERSPKLAIAVAYDMNQQAGRTRGQLGAFLLDENEVSAGKDLRTFFADVMFKYNNISLMAEFVSRNTTDNSPQVISEEDHIIGTYYTGSSTNLAIGYLFKKNWEVAGRWTYVNPHTLVANDENQYTIGLSKYIVGHKLKVQTDLTYRAIKTVDDQLIFRLQMDIHI